MKEELSFTRDLSLQNSEDSYFCLRLFLIVIYVSNSYLFLIVIYILLHSGSYFFFPYQLPSSSLSTVFDPVQSYIGEGLSITPSANVFVFRDFTVHHNDWLTYSGGTHSPGEICYNFSIRNDFTQMVLFCWISFFLLSLVFVSQWLSLNWEILIMLLSQFPLTFLQTQKGMPLFIVPLMAVLELIEMFFMIIWEMFQGRISLNLVLLLLVLLLLLLNFVSGSGLDLTFISLTVNIRSSLIHLHGLQLLVLIEIIEIIFFVCTNRINLLHLGLIVAKEFLKLPNLFILIKQKTYYFPETKLPRLLANCTCYTFSI